MNTPSHRCLPCLLALTDLLDNSQQPAIPLDCPGNPGGKKAGQEKKQNKIENTDSAIAIAVGWFVGWLKVVGGGAGSFGVCGC